jgi:aspartate kinase
MKVMKFGGTSVADQPAIERLIALVRAERQAEAQTEGGDARGPVVVVSALSGVTDRLLGVAALAGSGDVEGARTSLQDLRARHVKVSDVIKDQSLRQPVVDALNREFDELERVVTALAVLQEVSPRWLDALAATGEILSSQIVAAALTSHKLLATHVDSRKGRRHRRGTYRGGADVRGDHRGVDDPRDPPLAAGRIPVIGGFVGATTNGVTTTLGRGGSDFSAAIVGACLGASEIQIWTDVDGMLTADPRIVKNPQVVPHLSFAEASELAYFGAKVLHPATIQPAVSSQHSRTNPQFASRRRARHADHGGAPQRGTSVDGGRLEEGCDRRRHHVDAHVDGARVPAPAVRSVRAPQDGCGRRHDLRGQRVGDD